MTREAHFNHNMYASVVYNNDAIVRINNFLPFRSFVCAGGIARIVKSPARDGFPETKLTAALLWVFVSAEMHDLFSTAFLKFRIVIAWPSKNVHTIERPYQPAPLICCVVKAMFTYLQSTDASNFYCTKEHILKDVLSFFGFTTITYNRLPMV